MSFENLPSHNRHLDSVSGDEAELYSMIDEGEHQRQDFKFRIDSSQKIARTLSAFANTDGGRLLIGVKDNGRIAGVDPEEEFYMIQGAADLYCKPPVAFKSRVLSAEDKLVLEIDVKSSESKPHLCKETSGKWLAYVRQEDENFVANAVLLSFMRDKSLPERKNLIAYGPEERLLFEYLSEHKEISLSKFARIAKIPFRQAEKILALFLKWNVINWKASERGIRFYLLD